MTRRPPNPNLNPEAMPWARSVEQRIDELLTVAQQNDWLSASDSSQASASADGIAAQIAELDSVSQVVSYAMPPFSMGYAGIPIGGTARQIDTPVWSLNIPPWATRVSVITNANVTDTSYPMLGPRGGRMALSVSGEASILQGQYDTDANPLPRTAMLTVNASHPLRVSLSFLSTSTSSGTLSGSGKITLVLYGGGSR